MTEAGERLIHSAKQARQIVSDSLTQSSIFVTSPHFPISVNAAFRNTSSRDGKKKGRIRTERYTSWVTAVGYDINAAMRGRVKIAGKYKVRITLSKAKRHPLADLGNFEKAVQDALQTYGVIANDRFCEGIVLEWGECEGFEAEVMPWM